MFALPHGTLNVGEFKGSANGYRKKKAIPAEKRMRKPTKVTFKPPRRTLHTAHEVDWGSPMEALHHPTCATPLITTR
jgi:hypothetical protein